MFQRMSKPSSQDSPAQKKASPFAPSSFAAHSSYMSHGYPGQANTGSGAFGRGTLGARDLRMPSGIATIASNEPGGHAGNRSGLPLQLKSGIEQLSGHSMDDVEVHTNSPEPARFGAHAFARGTDIHLASGEEKHLPHEAWHVVQQKQGRVQPTQVQAHGAPINDDAGLEREADQMGAKAVSSELGMHYTGYSSASPLIQQQIMQRKKVPTDYGEFETTKFAEATGDAAGKGVEITLKFHPDESKVDAKKIALSQSLRKTTETGTPYAIDPNQAGKMVGSGKPGAGYVIDQLSDVDNPIYSQGANLGPTKTLKDTPKSSATPAVVGVNTNYELGHCFKEKPTDATKKKHSAGLWDEPTSGGKKGESKMFETTAFAIDGADKDKYYGSVKWGFTMEGTEAAPTVTKTDIESASMGTPTSNFIEAAKLWNSGKTRGTLKVTADPEATVLNAVGTSTEKLAKDSKLKQLDTVMWGPDPAIKVEVLKADGTGSGKIVYIKNSDVKDMGDGAPTKDLPT